MPISNYVFIIAAGFVVLTGLIFLIFSGLTKIISSSVNNKKQSIVAIVID